MARLSDEPLVPDAGGAVVSLAGVAGRTLAPALADGALLVADAFTVAVGVADRRLEVTAEAAVVTASVAVVRVGLTAPGAVEVTLVTASVAVAATVVVALLTVVTAPPSTPSGPF